MIQALSLPHTSSRSIGQSKCHGQVQCLQVWCGGRVQSGMTTGRNGPLKPPKSSLIFFTLFHSVCDLSSQPGIKDILPAMETLIPDHWTAIKVPKSNFTWSSVYTVLILVNPTNHLTKRCSYQHYHKESMRAHFQN